MLLKRDYLKRDKSHLLWRGAFTIKRDGSVLIINQQLRRHLGSVRGSRWFFFNDTLNRSTNL